MNDDHDYDAWVRNRRAVSPPDDLTGRILSAIESQAVTEPVSQRSGRRLIQVLVWVAASLLLVARLAAMVGNLIYPTGYPEFASDQRIEELPHEHRNVSRS